MNFHKKLFTIAVLFLFFLNFPEKLFANTKDFEWQPVGVDNYGNITQWINLLSYKPLNNDSFRMQMKLVEGNKQILGRLDINCRNKDYYLRKRKQMSQRGAWKSLVKGSSFEEIAQFHCKKTDAAPLWGYTSSTKYLWDIDKPSYPAASLKGNWITLYKNNSREFKYNSNTQKVSNTILAAYFYQKNQSFKNNPYVSRKSEYGWIAVSCKTNLHSTFKKFSDLSSGEWLAPKSGPIGGGASLIRKAKCSE